MRIEKLSPRNKVFFSFDLTLRRYDRPPYHASPFLAGQGGHSDEHSRLTLDISLSIADLGDFKSHGEGVVSNYAFLFRPLSVATAVLMIYAPLASHFLLHPR